MITFWSRSGTKPSMRDSRKPRGIVTAHGGRIWVESAVGAGTTVYVALPVAGPPAAANPGDDDGSGR